MPAPEPVALFERHCVLMANSDLEPLKDLYTPTAFYYDPLSGKLTGAGQIAPYLASIGEYFDTFTVEINNAWTCNDRAAIEWLQITTRGGVEARMRGVAVITDRDGAIDEHRDFFTLGRPDAAEEIRRHLVLPSA
jgi:hypothetical protein